MMHNARVVKDVQFLIRTVPCFSTIHNSLAIKCLDLISNLTVSPYLQSETDGWLKVAVPSVLTVNVKTLQLIPILPPHSSQ